MHAHDKQTMIKDTSWRSDTGEVRTSSVVPQLSRRHTPCDRLVNGLRTSAITAALARRTQS